MTAPQWPRYVRRHAETLGEPKPAFTRRERKVISRASRMLAFKFGISRVYVNAVARRNDVVRSTLAEMTRERR